MSEERVNPVATSGERDKNEADSFDVTALIAEAGKHVPYPVIMDDASWCMRCADEWPCLTSRLADALEAATRERDAALTRIAELEPKYPEGWSAEDRQEAKQEAERRWSRPVSREAEQRYNAGNINGFILGAEWQKARETFISYKAIADEARAERDAALAAVERVRKYADERSVYAKTRNNTVGSWRIASDLYDILNVSREEQEALDGAPEPEGRWEYRGRLQSCGYVAEGYISAEHAMNGLKVELEDHPYLQMDDTAIVERARVREWLPVEGEQP